MTKDDAAIYMLKGVISELPVEQRKKIEELQQQITEIVKKEGDIGMIALSVVSLELSKN